MKPSLFFFATLILALWVQVAVNLVIGGVPVAFHGLLILTLYLGLTRGPLMAQWMGFFWGLLLDASALGPMGLHALLLMIAGYGAGIFRRQLDGTKPWTQTIFTGVASLLYVAAYTGLDHLFSRSPRPWGWAAVFEPFANALLAPLVFTLMDRWSGLWGLVPTETE